MVNILFADRPEMWSDYAPHLRRALDAEGLTHAVIAPEMEPQDVDYIVYAPSSFVQDFRPYTRLKGVMNLWAGVEDVIGNETLTAPLMRMVDPGLTDGMVQWVLAHTLRHHMDIDTHIHGQDGEWRSGRAMTPLMSRRKVGILGLGELGGACGAALAGLGFQVMGWSRSPKNVPGVTNYTGEDGLNEVLSNAEILILLTPLTSKTENLLNAERLSRMPKGAFVLNPGRGGLVDDAALLAALDSGAIAHATLDTFRVEPLPPEHAYWSHPRVTVTPHIASETRSDTASEQIAANIARCERGEPFLYVVDRTDR